MKKGCLVFMSAVFAFALLGCGAAGSGTDATAIEELPYAVPYYKDASLQLTGVELYQTEIDEHGKTQYSPYVLLYFDKSGMHALSEDDRYWGSKETTLDYSVYITESDNEITREKLTYITSGTAGGREYSAYGFDIVFDEETYYNDFSGANLDIYIHVARSDPEDESAQPKREIYSYSPAFETAASANDMNLEIQEKISEAMWKKTENYVNNLQQAMER